jgi:DNA-binding SARP family transcriptional activator
MSLAFVDLGLRVKPRGGAVAIVAAAEGGHREGGHRDARTGDCHPRQGAVAGLRGPGCLPGGDVGVDREGVGVGCHGLAPFLLVLGPLTVDGNGSGLPPREQVVLAALTVRRGEVVTAETLADAWWGERVPATWTKALGCVVQLRKVLGAAVIETRPHGYCLVVPADEVDACRFERLVARAREQMALGEPDRAAYVVDEALRLWRGQALVDLDRWEPGRVEATRLEQLRLDAEELRLDAMTQAGRSRAVLAEAQTRVSEQPLREHRWTLLALAQYQAGRQGDALRTLYGARRVLAEELGLDPGPDLVALEEAILRQDPSLVADQMPEPSATCPYMGRCPTTSATPTRSSAVTRPSPSACGGWPMPGCRSSSGRPGPASPRSCGRGSRRLSHETTAGSSSSRRGRGRRTRCRRSAPRRGDRCWWSTSAKRP